MYSSLWQYGTLHIEVDNDDFTNIQDTRIAGVQEDTDINNKSDKYGRVESFDNDEFTDKVEGLSR